MMARTTRVASAVLIVLLFAGCRADSRQELFATTASAVQLRSYQTRAFDTIDRTRTLRTVIATLQDLSFVVDKAGRIAYKHIGAVNDKVLNEKIIPLVEELQHAAD